MSFSDCPIGSAPKGLCMYCCMDGMFNLVTSAVMSLHVSCLPVRTLLLQTYYLVACTSDGASYKVVEFDRHEPKELVWRDSGVVHDEASIKELLAKLRAEHGVLKKTGLREVATAFGVVGELG